MAIQFVVVKFDEMRKVLLDGVQNGNTGESIRVAEGTYEFSLDGDANYSPQSITKTVTNTTVLDPLILQFQLIED